MISLGITPVFLLAYGIFCASRSADRRESHDQQRYSVIRHLIRKKLHLSAYLVRAVDLGTIEAVRKEVSGADIPVLAELLSDKENVVAVGAQRVLETFGKTALPALQRAEAFADYRVSMKAKEAIAEIESKEYAAPHESGR